MFSFRHDEFGVPIRQLSERVQLTLEYKTWSPLDTREILTENISFWKHSYYAIVEAPGVNYVTQKSVKSRRVRKLGGPRELLLLRHDPEKG